MGPRVGLGAATAIGASSAWEPLQEILQGPAGKAITAVPE